MHTTPAETTRRLTVRDVAHVLRRCPTTVRRAIHAGHLRASKLNDGPWSISPDAVEAFVRKFER